MDLKLEPLAMETNNRWQTGDREFLACFDESGEYDGWELWADWYFVTNYGNRLEAIAISNRDRVLYCSNYSESSNCFFQFADGEYCENSQVLSAYVMQVIDFLNFCLTADEILKEKR